MRKFGFASALIAFVFAAFVFSVPAQAQATRTWVSGVGDDANPCSRTAPCKTFAGAISKTTASGEIDCLDPGGFGGVTITKAMTIRCDGVSNGGVLVSGTNGITVAAGATDHVFLSGLDFEGIGPANTAGLNGVKVLSGLDVYIVNCQIRDFTGAGGSGNGNGVSVTSTTSGTRVVIKDSIIENNGGGVYLQGNGVGNSVGIENTLIDGNSSFAVQVGTSGNTIALQGSNLTGSPAAIINGGGNVVSYGPSNRLSGTGSVTSTTTWQ
jgi:hypothetical protein